MSLPPSLGLRRVQARAPWFPPLVVVVNPWKGVAIRPGSASHRSRFSLKAPEAPNVGDSPFPFGLPSGSACKGAS